MATTTPTPVVVQRVQRAAVCAVLVAVALKQAPRQVVGDTKLGIVLDPAGFLRSALHLWDPTTDFGVAQNQGYGYLFPMGPFFLLGRAAGLAPWLVQRLWWAGLLVLAFLGLVRLADRLEIGSPTSRVLAGLAFALSPRLLSTLGPISVESLPYCLAPWVLAPLVTGSRRGSTRKAAACSALAVFCMGAVNAVAVLAALPPAVLWLLTRERGRRRRSLTGWWLGCTALATAWWVVPLLLLGRYSAPFLDHIEAAATTTSVTSLVEVLRGTSDWVAYLTGSHGPTWPAGFALLTEPLVIAFTVVVLLAGQAGLLLRDLPERLWLIGCLLVGAVALTFGHVGPLDAPWAGVERDLLDGVLVPFRNVHKFDVVLRLPLALGLAHLLPVLVRSGPADGEGGRRRAVQLGAVAALLGSCLPVLTPGLAPRHPLAEVPGYWRSAAAWLDDHPVGRTLVLPGTGMVDYLWGSPNDEPFQVVARTPWATRSAVPLTPSSTIRALDAVEARLAAGRGSSGLAPFLARAGVRYLLVRNDLDYGATGSTRPLLVHQALLRSPGIDPVATFGGEVGGGAFGRLADEGLELSYRALEVFEVAGAGEQVALHRAADAVRVSGGAEGLLDLDDRGLLEGRPALLGAAGPQLQAPVVLTDSLRRREVFFGRQQDNASPTLTRDEPYRLDVPAHDYLPPGADRLQAVARYVGARAVTASSSASDAAAFPGADPEHAPYAAVDGDPTTSWRSDPARGPEGSTWRLVLDAPHPLTGVRLQVDQDAGPVTQLRISGDGGTTDVTVDDSGTVKVSLPTSRSLEVRALNGGRFGSFGLLEVTVPGVRVSRTVDTAAAPGSPVIAVDAAEGARRGCYEVVGTWLCGTGLDRSGEEALGLDRTLHVGAAGTHTVAEVLARPRAGAALDALLARGAPAQVTASSSAVPDPRGDALAAVDGALGTGWRAGPGDEDARLELTWSTPQRLTGLRVQLDPSLAASRPQRARIDSAAGTREVELDRSGRARFAPLTASSVTVRLQDPAVRVSIDPYSQGPRLLPVGVSELTMTGADVTGGQDGPVRLPCGAGPEVQVGDVVVRTSLTTTVGALRDLSVVPLQVCEPRPVPTADGTRLRALSTSLLTPVSVTLLPAARRPSPVVLPNPDVRRWTATDRAVGVPARTEDLLLQVHENANEGWVATLAGTPLESVELDGWQQGWIVPAGAAGEVQLRFSPDRTYRAGLLAGGLLVLVLLVLVLLPAGLSTVPPVSARRRGGAVLGAALVVAVGGLTGLAAVLACFALHRLRVQVRWLAIPAVAAAGALLVWKPWTTADYAGRSAVAQALCVTGLAAAWTVLLGEVPRRVSLSRSSGRSRST